MSALTQTINIRTSVKIKKDLEKYSKKLNISSSKIINNAIESYVEWRIPQILALQESIKQADIGVFATEKEVEKFFLKYGN